MVRDLFEDLKKLCEAPGVSGFEDEVRKTILELLREAVDKAEVDNLGNLISKINEGGYPHVMLVAHMDEASLIIKHINEDGTLSFDRVGGINPINVVGRKVTIWGRGGEIREVIGIKPPHLPVDEEERKTPDIKDLFIDLGFENRRDVEEAVSIGDYATIDEPLTLLPKGKISGKALDDRAGCLVLIEVAHTLGKLKVKSRVSIVFSAQEEVGERGARVAAYRLNPDLALAVDVTHAGGYPGVSYREAPSKVGGGPAISVGTPIDRGFSDLLVKVAKEEEIPYQLYAESGATHTDIDVVQIVRGGIRAGLANIPLRYMHSRVEDESLKAIEYSIELISKFLEKVADEIMFK